MADCYVLGCFTKCRLAPFFTVECHAEAQASAICSYAVRINLCSLVKTKGALLDTSGCKVMPSAGNRVTG